MARIRREQSAVRVAATTVEPERSGAMMSGKRDHKFDEKKRAKNKKVIENGTTGRSVSSIAMIQTESKLAKFKYKFK